MASFANDFETVQTLLDGNPRYDQVVPMNGINFNLHFSWNGRDEHWYLSVHDEDDIPISGFTSRKLVANWTVSRWSKDPNQPYGYLTVSTNGHNDPALQNLGLESELIFMLYP